MKTIDRRKRYWVVGAALVAAFGLLWGSCSDDEGSPTDGGGPSFPITVQEIIASPKSAGPGDTLLLSAIVVSSSPNPDDVPTVSWTANGGSFLEDDQNSVRWIASANGVFNVVARAQNTVSASSDTLSLFVGATDVEVLNQAGEIRLSPNGTDLYFLHTGNNPGAGVEVFLWVANNGQVVDAVTTPSTANGANNDLLVYAPDFTFEVHSVDSLNPGASTQAIHLYLGDFFTGEYRRISNAPPADSRFPQFIDADVSPDSRYIAYGGMLPTPVDAGVDSFDIFVYDNATPTRTRVTGSHTNHRNAFPTWSTDQRWLTYVSDRSARNQWDLYGSPVSGGVVDVDQASLVRLSNTGGVLVDGDISTGDLVKPLMAWNPSVPTLAVVASDGFLYYIITTPTGATQVDVPYGSGLGIAAELVWSPDGSTLAVSTGGELITVTGGFSVTRLVRSGDTFADLAWSPDGAWLLYRATRSSSSWIEAMDINGSTLSVPIPITAAHPVSSPSTSLAAYRLIMSMSPVWATTGLLYYPTFGTGANTVGIASVDVSGLVP